MVNPKSVPQHITTEAEILDVLSLFADTNPSINGIARKLGISKQRVVSRLHEAFTSGVVSFPLFPNSPYGNSLGDLFGGVEFRVINAKHEFDVLSALQVLSWLRDIISELVLFQRVWHKTVVQLSNSLLTGKWQRGLPKL